MDGLLAWRELQRAINTNLETALPGSNVLSPRQHLELSTLRNDAWALRRDSEVEMS